jgi:hypothetical protein
MSLLRMIVLFLRTLLRDRAELAAENLALRQQLAALSEQKKRPRLRRRDRIFWTWLSRLWSNWHSALVIVQPETVVRCCPSMRSLHNRVGHVDQVCSRSRANRRCSRAWQGAPAVTDDPCGHTPPFSSPTPNWQCCIGNVTADKCPSTGATAQLLPDQIGKLVRLE